MTRTPKPAASQEPPVSSREAILARVRAATAGAAEPPGPRRDYRTAHAADDPAALADLLAVHLADYRATVHRTTGDGLPAVLAGILAGHGVRRWIAPAGVPDAWLAGCGGERVTGDGLGPAELDTCGAVVTGCAVAIAETGTIVLDAGPDQGRRALTLVPDVHVVVVRAPDQVVASVPQALPRLDPARPLTWISGPSATSDIELDRVEGVHGPRTLHAVLVGPASRPPSARDAGAAGGGNDGSRGQGGAGVRRTDHDRGGSMSEQEGPQEELTGDEVYQPQPGEDVTEDTGLLDPADTLDDRGIDPALDEGYSPPERPMAVDGHGGGDRGTLDERLAAEEPERSPDPARADRATRSGRLIGGGTDDVTATDAGIAGGAASAEEAAVHTVDDEDEPAADGVSGPDEGEGEDGGAPEPPASGGT